MKMLACLALLTLAAMPQTGAPPPGGGARQPAEQAIRERLRVWDEAYKVRDVQQLSDVLADGFTMTDATGAVLTKLEYLMSIVKAPDFGRAIPHESTDVKIEVAGGTATVTGRSAVKGRGRGRAQAFAGDYRFTDRWVNQNGTWRAAESRATSVTSR